MLPNDKQRTALITGATSGIGKATATIFAKKEGYNLILTGRRQDRLDELRTKLTTKYGVRVHLLCFDVRSADACERAYQSLPEQWKKVDILINNAGLAKGLDEFQESNLDHWETMIDTNVKGLLYMSKLVSANMVQQKSGHIINICSTAGHEVYYKGSVYCATKYAVDALTKGMRLDLHKYGIKVGQISPGHVEETEFALTRFDGDAEKAKIYEDFTPLKSKDVADAILYMVTRPQRVNIHHILITSTQQANATTILRNGRGPKSK